MKKMKTKIAWFSGRLLVKSLSGVKKSYNCYARSRDMLTWLELWGVKTRIYYGVQLSDDGLIGHSWVSERPPATDSPWHVIFSEDRIFNG